MMLLLPLIMSFFVALDVALAVVTPSIAAVAGFAAAKSSVSCNQKGSCVNTRASYILQMSSI